MIVDFAIKDQREHLITTAKAIYQDCLVQFRPIMMIWLDKVNLDT
jgi:multidrug efflux pump subunit AcrB